MQTKTRSQFEKMMTYMVDTYGGHYNGRDKFSIDPIAPELEQRLEKRIQEKSTLLKKINVVGVRDLKGEKIGLSAGTTVAGRTNTDQAERQTRYIGELDGREYELKKTDFDSHITYKMMDTWSAYANFRAMYGDKVFEQIARDRTMIGWSGETAAATTDRTANPLLQDVNRGWLSACEADKPANWIADAINVGATGQYKTLDECAFDLHGSLLEPWHQNSPDLIVILGKNLWHKHNLTLLRDNSIATERNALDAWIAKERMAGMSVVLEPFFPVNSLLITSYDNLSLYYQQSARRRTIIDNPRRDRIEDYQSDNEGYVVEDYGKFGGAKQINMV